MLDQAVIAAELKAFTPDHDGQDVITPARWRDDLGRSIFTVVWLDGESGEVCCEVLIGDPVEFARERVEQGRTVLTRLVEEEP